MKHKYIGFFNAKISFSFGFNNCKTILNIKEPIKTVLNEIMSEIDHEYYHIIYLLYVF